MRRFRHLLVGLTRTDTDEDLLRYVAMVVRLGTATDVRFVHCAPVARPGQPVADHDAIVADLRERVARAFADVPPSVQLHFSVGRGTPVDCLLQEAADHHVELMFLGHRRDRSGRRSLARRLAMKAPCSVWMVPEGSPAALRRILVPVDFSPPSADAMRVATSLARLAGLEECLAFHAYFNEAVVTYDEYDQVLLGQEREAFERFIGPIDRQGVVVRAEFEECVDPSHAILRAAEQHGSDVIVMATRGRSRSAAVLLGSVTEATMMAARTPVLAVKHFGARLGLVEALLDRRFGRPGLHTD
jgi:nucleotide-binding universal stress UspA family protein